MTYVTNKRRRKTQARRKQSILAAKAFKPCPLTEKKTERVFEQTNTPIAIFAQYYIIEIRLLCVNFSWKEN